MNKPNKMDNFGQSGEGASTDRSQQAAVNTVAMPDGGLGGAVLPKLDVSILVVSYNTRAMTLECLASVFAETRHCEFEVLVVDNLSSDGSCGAIREAFPNVVLVEPGENLGFAKANNLAGKQARGRYILLLNPDTVVLDQAIDRLVEFADSQGGMGIFGGRTLYADGSLNHASCWGRPTLWSSLCLATGLSVLGRFWNGFDPETMRRWRRDSTRHVDIISGCFLLVPRELWESLEGFDPEFTMYGEDFDLCLRARKSGVRCLVYPGAKIVHYGSASESVKADQLVRQMRARVQLFRKHWPRTSSMLGESLLRLRVFSRGYADRLPLGNLKGRKDAAQAWREAWRRRGEWLRPRAGG